MRSDARWNVREWVFLTLLVGACATLGFFQYRWTGELSRAETESLRSSARARTAEVARAFDSKLSRAVLDLVPTADDVDRDGWERANVARLQAAPRTSQAPLFRGIFAAVPEEDNRRTLELYKASEDASRFLRLAWPESPGWNQLRARLQELLRGGSLRADIVDPESDLIEVPVFGRGGEREWIIAELNPDYIAGTWFPELARTYLNAAGTQVFRLDVSSRANPQRVLFSTGPGAPSGAPDGERSVFPARFAVLGIMGENQEGEEGRWIVQVRHVAGSIDAATAAARVRNLAVAAALLGLILLAATALLRYTRRSQQLAELQFRFVAGVSHELRTPLTVIQGAAHNLLSGVVKQPDQRETYLRAILKHAAQLGEAVDQLLSYAGVRHARASVELGPVSLETVLTDAVDFAASELEASRRSVDLDVPADLPPVQGDAIGLQRVFRNLIANAIRHGGGEIAVSAVRDGAIVEVRVADPGQGIPKAEIRKIFDPFFRGERARQGHIRGTGLGLSLVKETVERMGGTVSVHSVEGRGTTFAVRLPVCT